MTQEDRNLLIRDVCARIPYGVKGINCNGYISSPKDWETEFCILTAIKHSIVKYEWRPYLFPLSSMTLDQKIEYSKTLIIFDESHCSQTPETYDWLNKNHFDYRGLIPKGGAIDATGLNIY